jgi:uncharacterized protein (DUF2235 family)
MKRLVVCCDGTWDVPQRTDEGVPSPSNVSKLYDAVAPEAPDGTKQVPFYEPGVGSRRREHLRGGAFGFGLSRNVRECYGFLIEKYEPGDELFFFGFSRGAFTARSTVGFVRNSGILLRENADRIDEAFQLYRDRDEATKPGGATAQDFRGKYSHPDTRIHFVGVWDTVGSLGVPLNIPFLTKRWSFHDTNLSTWVDNAFHAVAIDERRKPFRPTLWTQKDPTAGQTLEQVFFSGVHCNIGGGYRDTGLSDIALLWMAGHANQAGLALDLTFARAAARPAPNALGKLRNSMTVFYSVFGSYERPVVAAGGSVASSALRRRDDPPSHYDPRTLVGYTAPKTDVVDSS